MAGALPPGYAVGRTTPSPPDVNPRTNPNAYGPPAPLPPFKATATANMDPVGGNHPFANPAQTKFVQTKLRQLGYNVTPDGVAGPVTLSAYHAYLTGVHPGAWAGAYSANHKGGSTPPPVAPTGHPGISPHDGADPGTVPTGGGGGSPPAKPAAYTDPALAAMAHLIDPLAYAKASAASSDDPKINALVRSMASNKDQQGADQADIANWYAQLVGQANASHATDQTAFQNILGSEGGVAKGLVDSLGGAANPAAAQAAAMAQSGANELGANSLADLNANQGLKNSFAQQGVGQRLLSKNAFLNQQHTDQGTLQDLEAQKGNDYRTALDNAYNLRSTQAKNLQNAEITSALAGPQLAAAQANVKAAQIANQTAQWRLKLGMQQNGTTASTPDFEKQDPTKLSSYLLQGALGPKGNFNQSPADILSRMSSMIKTVSYGKYDPATDPRVKQFLVGLVQSHLAGWNRQNPHNKFVMQGGKLVHTK